MATKFYTKLSRLFLFVLLMPVTFLQAQVNEAEPNNTTAQANIFPLNGSISAALNPAGDVDWYTITTTSDGQLNITFDNSGNGDLKAIILFDYDGVTQLNSSLVGNGVGGINTNGLAAGIYYVEISGRTGTETGAYTLSNNLIIPARANDIEPNNNIMQAERLLLNNSVTGHLGYYYNHYRDTSDWYKVTTTADGQLDIAFDNNGNADVKTVILYDTIGGPQLNSGNIGNGVGGFNTNGLAAGTYYIQIIGNNPNDFGPYLLYDSLEIAGRTNDAEPNNNFIQATVLAINDSVKGHYGYYYDLIRDTADWYKITIPVSGRLSLTLDNSGNANIVDLNLYDASGTNIINSDRIGDGTGNLETDTLAPGVYYVQVTEGDGGQYNQFGAYLVSNNLLTTLPVTFVDFNGKLLNNQVLLTWETGTENNNKGFEVQKSTDKQNFSAIGFVTGYGNSSVENNYTFTDINAVSGSSYYRLKQIDIDNHFIYSPVIKIDESFFSWTVSGNPVSGNTWIQLQMDKTAHVVIQVISIEGKIIQVIDKGNLSAGTFSIPLNFSNTRPGMYIVRLATGNQSYTKKIIK